MMDDDGQLVENSGCLSRFIQTTMDLCWDSVSPHQRQQLKDMAMLFPIKIPIWDPLLPRKIVWQNPYQALMINITRFGDDLVIYMNSFSFYLHFWFI